MTTLSAFDAAAILVVLAAALGYFNVRYFKLPSSVGLTVIRLLASGDRHRFRAPQRGRGKGMTKLRAFAIHTIVAVAMMASWGLASAGAQQGPAAAVEASPPAPSAEKVQVEQIADLTAGKLATDVDAESLFTTSLSGAGGLRLRWVISLIGNDRLHAAAQKDPSVLEGLSAGEAALAVAQADFLRLPQSRRAAILADHRRRQAEARRSAVEAEQSTRRIEELRQTIAGLQAFLAGKPAPPASLTIDMLDPSGAALARDRRRALLADAPEAADAEVQQEATPADAPGSGATIAALTRQIDELYRRILSLPPSERRRLGAIQAAASGQYGAEALAVQRVNEQLAAANKAATRATTESDRLIASERQRLLAIKKALAASRLKLARQSSATHEITETSLGWRRQVSALVETSPSKDVADKLYVQLIDALRDVRTELAGSLSQAPSGGIALPRIPPLDNLLPPNDPRTASMQRLNRELAMESARLSTEASEAGWARRAALYRAMTEMNAARLALIPSLSGDMRGRITGFDEEGFAQVRRELNQIALTVRYNVALGVKHIGHLGETSFRLGSGTVFGLIQLLAVVVLFRIWRRRGDPILASMERGYVERRPPTLSSSFLAMAIGLVRKVRRPLDWLLLFLAVRWLIPDPFDVAVVAIVWLVVVWFLVAAVTVQLIDAVAQGARRDDPRAELRRRSLRLVIGTALGVGLALSLTAASVGHGAIYSWVLTCCWLLVIPVVVLLANWWRERITALATLASPHSAIFAWVSTHPDGISGTLGRILAGALLLLQGAKAVLAKRVSQLALIREISGQRARERAAARVIADEASGRYAPIPLAQAERLAPHGRPDANVIDHLPVGHSAMPGMLPGRLIAVVGERGLGKTTAVGSLLASRPDSLQIEVTADTSGFDGIVAALAGKLGCEAEAEAVRSRLREKHAFVAVDDVQRLVIPAIGGLAGFDKLIALARSTGVRTAWVFAIGGPAWNYLSRARADRALFDDVVILKRWSTEDICGLIERRTEQAGIAPVFNLEIYSTGTMLFDSEISPEERARRAYFEELTAQSDGNPAVALEFWRRSLFEDRESGAISVRTYKAPDLVGLSSLPKSTFFVLRAILQMEVAAESSIVKSTDLPEVVVAEALRALVQLGVIQDTGNAYRLCLYWYQDVRRLLERQNLIVRSVS